MTQIEFSEKYSIKYTHLNKILHGKRNPRPKLAQRLEDLTGIDFKVWVIGDKETRLREWRKFQQRCKNV